MVSRSWQSLETRQRRSDMFSLSQARTRGAAGNVALDPSATIVGERRAHTSHFLWDLRGRPAVQRKSQVGLGAADRPPTRANELYGSRATASSAFASAGFSYSCTASVSSPATRIRRHSSAGCASTFHYFLRRATARRSRVFSSGEQPSTARLRQTASVSRYML